MSGYGSSFGIIFPIFSLPAPSDTSLIVFPSPVMHSISVENVLYLPHHHFQVTRALCWIPVVFHSGTLSALLFILATIAAGDLLPAGFDQISIAFRGQNLPECCLCPSQIPLALSLLCKTPGHSLIHSQPEA